MSTVPTNSGPVIRIGTRASNLARAQSTRVADALTQATGRRTELVLIRTEGDLSSRPLVTMEALRPHLVCIMQSGTTLPRCTTTPATGRLWFRSI